MLNEQELIKKFEQTPEGKHKIQRLEESIATYIKQQTKRSFEIVQKTNDNMIRFIAMGDTHIGSLYERVDVLKSAYILAEKEGIETVLHAGDIIDGHNIYKGQEFELHKHGWDAQLEWLKDQVPDTKIKTFFITGNHDSSFKKQAGIEPGKAFEASLKNWVFLGSDIGELNLKTSKGSGFKVALIHPGGGSAYALSYRPQKTIEQWEGGKKPDMLLIGHYHKAEFIPSYRNVSVLQVGTCQNQTPFMVRGALAAHVGFWLVSVYPGKNHTRISAEFISIFK